jgi:hypothetical protein
VLEKFTKPEQQEKNKAARHDLHTGIPSNNLRAGVRMSKGWRRHGKNVGDLT